VILRGLLIAASGFVFIFSPGLPLSALTRRSPGVERGLIYWGLALWPLALLPALFLQSLLRQAVRGSTPSAAPGVEPVDYLLTLAGALIAALILQGAMVLLLHFKRPAPEETVPAGLSLGFGIGLISQVFTGLALVSAGFRLTLGETGDPLLTTLAQAEGWRLALSLLPVILYRPALLVVSAARGLLVARSLTEGFRLWLVAVVVDTLFSWLSVASQLALGTANGGEIVAGATPPLTAVVTAVYYVLAFALAMRWIIGYLTPAPATQTKRVKRPTPAVTR
jgi:hypothetical protein